MHALFLQEYLCLVCDALAHLNAMRQPPSLRTQEIDLAPPSSLFCVQSPPPSPPETLTKAKTPPPSPAAVAFPPLQQTKQPLSKNSQAFALHQLELPADASAKTFQTWEPLMSALFPKIDLLQAPPCDTIAKQRKQSWKANASAPAVAIFLDHPKDRPFFQSVAKAITTCLAPAKIVSVHALEKRDQWELFLKAKPLRLTLIPDATLFATKKLLRYYREFPQEKLRFLGDVPLLLLPDPALYLKDPLLKRSLWHLIEKALR